MYGHNRYGSTRYGASQEDVSVFVKVVYGVATATSVAVRTTAKALSVSVAATGLAIRKAGKTFSSTVAATAAVGRSVGKTLSSTVAATGTIARKIAKTITGNVAVTGVVVRKVSKAFATVTVTAVGTVSRIAGKIAAGGVIVTATIARLVKKTLTATVIATATVNRKTGKNLAGTVAATGLVVRKAQKGLSATVLATGTRAAQFVKTVTASVLATGAVGRKIGKSLTSSVAATGIVIRKTGKSLVTTVLATGTVQRITEKIAAGGVVATAIVTRLVKKTLTATVQATATVNRKTSKMCSTMVTALGSIVRKTGKGLATTVRATGTVGRFIEKLISGGVVATATVGRLIKKTLTATVTARGIFQKTAYDMAYEMNKTIRKILGRVAITYTDPFFSAGIEETASETGRYTYPDQTTDNVETEAFKWFSLHRNVLDGTFHPLPSATEYSVGWWGTTLSDSVTAEFDPDPVLTIEHSERSVESLLVVGDDQLEEYPVDFWVRLYSVGDALEYEWHETGNGLVTWTKAVSPTESAIVKHVLTIEKWSRPWAVCKISQFFTMLEETYDSEDGELFSIRMLEEREFEEPTIPQGNISSNEITVRLNNIDDLFTAGNFNSRLHGMLLNNRAIRAWLGCDLHSGERIWFPLGTFFSRDWSTPEEVTWAEVRGLDMLDRLRRTEFSTSEVYENVTLHDLAVTVMADAGLTDADWDIDPVLDTADYTIPYAWFDRMSHREALRRIAAAALGQVYCDRDGKIVIEIYTAPAAQPYDFHFTEANFFTIDHPLQWSQMINYVQARADPRVPSAEQDICVDTETFTVPGSGSITKTHYFDLSPCVDVVDPLVFVDPGGHVTLDSMTIYAWGAAATYSNSDPGDETVTSVTIRGKPLEVQGGRVVVAEDATSIASNGKQTLGEPISSEFWQTETQAQAAADSLLATYKDPRRDVLMRARGNIALLLGDRVVAPDYRGEVTSEYGLMRQDINFDGGLEVMVTAQRIAGGETIYRKTLSTTVTAEGRPLWDSGLIGGYGHNRYGATRYGAAKGGYYAKELAGVVAATGDVNRHTSKELVGAVIVTGIVPLWESGYTGGYGDNRYGAVRYGAGEED